MKKSISKKALVMSLLSVVLCISMLIGTTFAWFTDTATNTGNRIVAGNLDVQLLKHNGTEYVDISGRTGDIFKSDGNGIKWEPGKTEIVYLAVRNNGNLALKYNIVLNVTDGGLVGSLEYAIADGVKAGEITETTWADIEGMTGIQTGTVAAGTTTAAPNGRLLAKADGDTEEPTDYFALAVHMSEEAGNDYQGKNIVIDVAVVATQLNYENDSFGPDYDEPATVPGVSLATEITPSTTDVSLSAETSNGITVTAALEAPLVASLASGTVTSVSLKIDPMPTTTNDGLGKSVEFSFADLIDQDGNVIDLEALGNTEDITVTLALGEAFAGEVVTIYHDGAFVAEETADPEGNVTYTTTHFCIVSVETEPLYRVKEVIPNEDGTTATVVYQSNKLANATKTETVRYLTVKNVGTQTTDTTFDIYCGDELVRAGVTFSNVFNTNSANTDVLIGRNVIEFPACDIYFRGDSYVNSEAIFVIGAKNSDGTPATRFLANGGASVSYKGLQLQNREAALKLRTYYFENVIFDGSAQQNKWGHLITMTCYPIDAEFNNVVFCNMTQSGRTSVLGVWANDTLSDGTYPTTDDNVGVTVILTNVKTENCNNKPFVQFQGFTTDVINANPDCYSYISIVYDEASGTNCGLGNSSAYTTQPGNNNYTYGDGIHYYWTVNGVEVASVEGTTVTLGE